MVGFKDLKKWGYNTESRFYTIAEIGINHGGDMKKAHNLIDSAARAGFNSVKFQTYKAEKRVSLESPIFNILKDCELGFKDFKELKDHADSLGVDFFSTPFDAEAVDFLLDLEVPFMKIASFDIVNKDLLKKVSLSKKPVIMSTGMSSLKEVQQASDIIGDLSKLTILHCVSSYPTKEKDANISVIDSLVENFNCVIGQSDHTPDIKTSLYSFLRGAQVLEKHFKIDEDFDCVDSPVSITEKQSVNLIQKLKEADEILGDNKLCSLEAELETVPYRRFS